MNAPELLALEIDPLRWPVPGLLPEGLTLVIGKPKAGKSWWALQLAVAVASGRCFLHRDLGTTAGDVLYLGLEDGRRRMRSRLQTVLGAAPAPARLSVVTIEDKWPRGDRGGAELVARWVAEHPEAQLIVIDTLGRFRPLENGRQNAYMADLAALEPLQQLALDRHMVVAALHHDNKSVKGEDWVYSISGTQAIAGTADTLVGLDRRRGSSFALLRTHGRDVDERTMILQLQLSQRSQLLQLLHPSHQGGWAALGSWVHSAELTAEREEVLAALVAAGAPLSASEVGRRIANEDRNAESGRIQVQRMIAADLLTRTDRGVFFAPLVVDTFTTSPVTPVTGASPLPSPIAPGTSGTLGTSGTITTPVSIGGGVVKEEQMFLGNDEVSSREVSTLDGAQIIASLRERGLKLRLAEDGQILASPRSLLDEADRALLTDPQLRSAIAAALAGLSL